MSNILYYLPEITLFITAWLLLDLFGSGVFRSIVRPRARRYWAAAESHAEPNQTHLRSNHIRLRLKGVLRSKPQGNWHPAECKAFFTVQPLSMVWYADVTRAFMVSVKMTEQFANKQAFSTRWLLSSFPYRWRKASLPAPLAQQNAFYALAAVVWQPSWWLQYVPKWSETHAALGCFTITLGQEELFLKVTFSATNELSEMSLWDKNWQNWQRSLRFSAYQELQGQRIPFRVEVLQKDRQGELFAAADLELTDWVEQGAYAWW